MTRASSTKGEYQPDTWGTWDLVKIDPEGRACASSRSASTPGYKYKYEDKDVVLGFTYWYYVAAYKEGTFTGPGGETTTRIETHITNRNGADGSVAEDLPVRATTTRTSRRIDAGKKAIGAVQVVVFGTGAAG